MKNTILPHVDRWEYGSEFHWPAFSPVKYPTKHPWESACIFYCAGRDAFQSIITHGSQKRGWKRLWIPSYFCQEVASTIATTQIDVRIYPDGPKDDAIHALRELKFKKGDALILVNYFGLRSKPDLSELIDNRLEIIEDHTHDPWSKWATESEANFCVASLRKTLPVPDGGIVWSPRGHTLPPQPPAALNRKIAIYEKMEGMLLKALYLQGHMIEKNTYRKLARSSEDNIAKGSISKMSNTTNELLFIYPIQQWRDKRLTNYIQLANSISAVPWVQVLKPKTNDVCPFSVILIFDKKTQRDYIQHRLIEERIYPSILWPLEKTIFSEIPDAHRELSNRMLSIHCDMRYAPKDLTRVANTIQRVGEEF